MWRLRLVWLVFGVAIASSSHFRLRSADISQQAPTITLTISRSPSTTRTLSFTPSPTRSVSMSYTRTSVPSLERSLSPSQSRTLSASKSSTPTPLPPSLAPYYIPFSFDGAHPIYRASPSAIPATPPVTIPVLLPRQLASLLPSQVPAIAPRHIAFLPPSHVDALSSSFAISLLAPIRVPLVRTSQLPLLSVWQTPLLIPSLLPAASGNVIPSFSSDQVPTLSPAQIPAASPRILAELPSLRHSCVGCAASPRHSFAAATHPYCTAYANALRNVPRASVPTASDPLSQLSQLSSLNVSPECDNVLRTAACAVAFPPCHAGATVAPCSSMCASVRALCQRELHDIESIFPQVVQCSGGVYVGGRSTSISPCVNVFEMGWLTSRGEVCREASPSDASGEVGGGDEPFEGGGGLPWFLPANNPRAGGSPRGAPSSLPTSISPVGGGGGLLDNGGGELTLWEWLTGRDVGDDGTVGDGGSGRAGWALVAVVVGAATLCSCCLGLYACVQAARSIKRTAAIAAHHSALRKSVVVATPPPPPPIAVAVAPPPPPPPPWASPIPLAAQADPHVFWCSHPPPPTPLRGGDTIGRFGGGLRKVGGGGAGWPPGGGGVVWEAEEGGWWA